MIKMKHRYFFIILGFFLISCNSNYTLDKKRGYFSIEFPQKEYRKFDWPGYPYEFEYPVYAVVSKDTTFFDEKPGNYWINIDIPRFDGRIYISYKQIGKNNFDSLIEDSYQMAFGKHTQVASYIEPEIFKTPNNIEGAYFSLGGNTATANQFFITDSTKHFLRGALYFDANPNEDSLSIVNEFLKKDLMHLINTLKWR
jgi:gliding motility-associated lipoprotein GldD